mmetsp:Transcript_26353/g.46369  ORF Transcript_26353/g.46369 Transcript_26353/m.46369 type:complete len:93 (+) Transcript_26353:2320-2598(+)
MCKRMVRVMSDCQQLTLASTCSCFRCTLPQSCCALGFYMLSMRRKASACTDQWHGLEQHSEPEIVPTLLKAKMKGSPKTYEAVRSIPTASLS